MKSRQRSSSQPALPRSRRRAFTIITLLFPVAVFALLELALRLFHYGPNLDLFTTEVIGGKTYHIMNPDVKSRYFSRVEFSPNTSPDYFAVPKPTGTFRIFCLGGSTTVGFPYSYAGSFTSYLRDRLQATFSERKIEVINLGMTATNSFTVVNIASELVDYEPDLILVYDGHNEFYGALGVASHESHGSSRWLTRLYLKLVHVRVFLLLRDMYSLGASMFLSPEQREATGTMMERLAQGQYIPYAGENYRAALTMFKENLNELADICREHDISLLLGGQVSNLRDQPPFVSHDAEENSPAQRLAFNTTLNRGITNFMDGEWELALNEFRHALPLDSLRADIHFVMAQCLDSLGRKREALAEYIHARDYDRLRFRASTDFNNAIQALDNDRTIAFVDIERKFRGNSPDELVGYNLILEHLHPNARGYFLIAKEYAWIMHLRGMLAPRQEWNEKDIINDEPLWDVRAMTTLDEMCAQQRIALLISGWPFRPEARPVPDIHPSDSLAYVAQQMVHGRITWERGHVLAAAFYEGRQQLDSAAREYRALINQIPLNVSAYLLLAQIYLKQGKNIDAASILLRSLDVEKTVFAYRILGTLALEPKDAIPFFEQALALSENTKDRSENGYLLAAAYGRSGERSRAIARLQEVLQINPQFAPAAQLLKRLNAEQR